MKPTTLLLPVLLLAGCDNCLGPIVTTQDVYEACECAGMAVYVPDQVDDAIWVAEMAREVGGSLRNVTEELMDHCEETWGLDPEVERSCKVCMNAVIEYVY